jgi:hypothetical protein
MPKTLYLKLQTTYVSKASAPLHRLLLLRRRDELLEVLAIKGAGRTPLGGLVHLVGLSSNSEKSS